MNRAEATQNLMSQTLFDLRFFAEDHFGQLGYSHFQGSYFLSGLEWKSIDGEWMVYGLRSDAEGNLHARLDEAGIITPLNDCTWLD